jgi:NADH-quinone oxidoreductase subunit J
VAAFAVTLCGFLMSALVSSSFSGRQGEYTVQAVSQAGNSQVMGKVLFTDFLFPFEVASIILLVAMVGAIVLAKKKAD